MNNDERKQIALILDFEARKCLDDLESRMRLIYADHSSRGLLRSGVTVRRAVATMRELIEARLADWSQKIGAISCEMEAHGAIVAACQRLLDSFASKLTDAVNVAGFDDATKEISTSVQRGAREIFAELRTDVATRLEILGFSFQAQATSDVADSAIHYPEGVVWTFEEDEPDAPTPTIIVKQEKRGRPSAEWWDEMWVAISMQLYSGDLLPKKQADIENAMHDWIVSHGQSAAPSSVRARARKLWDALQLTKDD